MPPEGRLRLRGDGRVGAGGPQGDRPEEEQGGRCRRAQAALVPPEGVAGEARDKRRAALLG